MSELSVSNLPSFDTSDVLSLQSKLELSSWGLPAEVLQKYSENGITKMFEWQVNCLCLPGVLDGHNLIYSAPTSAGKTLVAEIILLKRVLERGKKGIFILPFVSVTREKTFSLQKLFGVAGVRVEGFMGGQAPPGGLQRADIAICTIEKANNIINRLIEEKNLEEIEIIVVDELHMVGDPHRGYLLELLLTKIRFLSSLNKDLHIQIVGMSATLPNLNVLAEWQNARLYCTSFRPVPLMEMVKVNSTLYDDKFNPIRNLNPDLEVRDDADQLVQLCLETILEGFSTLIFCPAKAWCERISMTIAKKIYSIGEVKSTYPPHMKDGIRKRIDENSLSRVIDALSKSPSGLDSVLSMSLKMGVAFHHAGLTLDERDIIEGAFKAGYLPVLVATSTLSAGVNLPARRVIIRSPNMGSQLMNALTYKQMVGRAGRKGKDTVGESILMCPENEKFKATRLVQAVLPPISSSLVQSGSLTTSLKRAINEIVISGTAKTMTEIKRYWDCTFVSAIWNDPEYNCSQNENFSPSSLIEECVNYLTENELARVHKVDGIDTFVSTQLGRAILASGLAPDEGLHVFAELQRARKSFVLENELHVVYQVTPVYVSRTWPEIDWFNYLKIWDALPEDMRRVGELVGVQESFIAIAMRGAISFKNPKQKLRLDIHQRFLAALALHDLVHEIPLSNVVNKYGASKGLLQGLQQSAATFSGMVTIFCNRLGWHNMELLISQYQNRLHFGIQRDLCELVRLSLLNARRARCLYAAGLETVTKVAHSTSANVENILLNASPFESEKNNNKKDGFIFGPTGAPLSIREASEAIIQEAREIIQKELGVNFINWEERENKDITVNSCVSSTSGRRSAGRKKKRGSRRPRSTSLSRKRFKNSNRTTSFEMKDSSIDSNNSYNNNSLNRPSYKIDPKKLSVAKKINSNEAAETLIQSVKRNGSAEASTRTKNTSGTFEGNSGKCLSKNVENSLNKGIFADKRLKSADLAICPNKQMHKKLNDSNSTKDFVLDSVATVDKKAVPQSLKLIKQSHKTSTPKFEKSKGSFLFSKQTVKLTKVLSEDMFNTKESEVQINENKPKINRSVLKSQSKNSIRESFAQPTDNSMDDSFDIFAAQILNNSDLDSKKYDHQLKDHDDKIDSFSDSLTAELLRAAEEEDFIPNKILDSKMNQVSRLSDDLFEMSEEILESKPTSPFHNKTSYETLDHSSFYPALNETLDLHLVSSEKSQSGLEMEENIENLRELTNLSDSSCGSKESISIFKESENLTVSKTKLEKDSKQLKRNSINNPNDRLNYSLSDSFFNSFFETNVEEIQEKQQLTPKVNNKNNRTSLGNSTSLFLSPNTLATLKEIEPNRTIPATSMKESLVPNMSETARKFLDLSTKDDTIDDSYIASTQSLSIIDVASNKELFEVFLDEWMSQNVYSLSLACEPAPTNSSKGGIGYKVCGRNRPRRSFHQNIAGLKIENSNLLLTGIAICWGERDSYFINLKSEQSVSTHDSTFQTPPLSTECHLDAIIDGVKRVILHGSSDRSVSIRCWDAKRTINYLVRSGIGLIEGSFEDPRVGSWLLDPTAKEKNLHNLVLTYNEELLCLLDRIGSTFGSDGLGICDKNQGSSRVRSCTESVLIYHLTNSIIKEIDNKGMTESWVNIEMPSVCIFAKIELIGTGFSSIQAEEQKELMQTKMLQLEQQAYKLVGHPFSLSSFGEVSKVLYGELHLPLPNDVSSPSRTRSSARNPRKKIGPANKEALEKLVDKHPLPAIILQWRRINHALTKFVIPLKQEKLFNPNMSMDRIHPVIFTFTATGRITFQDPNLQNLPKDFEIEISHKSNKVNDLPPIMRQLAPLLDKSCTDEQTVSMRHMVVAGKGCVLISADYSQIELRVLAYLSKDEKLLAAVNNGEDVFKNIASQIHCIKEDQVTPVMRQQAKQISYGLIYGMGQKSLGQQLQLSESECNIFMTQFRRKFPVVQEFLKKCVSEATEKEFVTTLKQRRRYLPGILSSSPYIKAQCERQAINTKIQGSAADLIKMATIAIDKELRTSFSSSSSMFQNSRPKSLSGAFLVLQLHDELIYEVVNDDVIQVGQLIKHHMENVCRDFTDLSVKLPVRMKVGPSWGTMQLLNL